MNRGFGPVPPILYPIENHVSTIMHGILYYMGIAFISIGIVQGIRAIYLYRRKRNGKQD
jgi:hypothetical protein